MFAAVVCAITSLSAPLRFGGQDSRQIKLNSTMLANQIMALRSTRNHILTTSSDLQHLQVGRALALIFDIVTKYQEALMICWLLRGSLTWDQGACSRCQCSPSRGLSAVGLGRGAACCPHAIPGKGGPMAASTAHDCLAPTPGMHTAQLAWACGIRYTFTLPVDVRDTRTSCSTPCCTVVCATHER